MLLHIRILKRYEVTKQRQQEDSGNLTVKEMCPVLEIAATTNAGNDICLAVFQKQILKILSLNAIPLQGYVS